MSQTVWPPKPEIFTLWPLASLFLVPFHKTQQQQKERSREAGIKPYPAPPRWGPWPCRMGAGTGDRRSGPATVFPCGTLWMHCQTCSVASHPRGPFLLTLCLWRAITRAAIPVLVATGEKPLNLASFEKIFTDGEYGSSKQR